MCLAKLLSEIQDGLRDADHRYGAATAGLRKVALKAGSEELEFVLYEERAVAASGRVFMPEPGPLERELDHDLDESRRFLAVFKNGKIDNDDFPLMGRFLRREAVGA